MVDIPVRLKVVETQSQIQRMILDSIKAEINDILKGAVKAIERQVRFLFRSKLVRDDTWMALYGDRMRGELGLPAWDYEKRLGHIAEIWTNSIQADYKPVTGTIALRGGLSLKMIDADWEDVLSDSDATIIAKSSIALPWLEWLLKRGDEVIIKEYEVRITSSVYSRSGFALMVKPKKRVGRWHVPSEFAGTTNNNFVTRILDNIDDDVFRIVEEEITKRL